MYRAGLATKDDPLFDLIERLLKEPDQLLSMVGKNKITRPECQLFEPFDLVRALNKYAKDNAMIFKGILTEQRLGQLLRKRLPRRHLKYSRNRWLTLYAIYDQEKWRDADDIEWRDHWDAYRKDE